MNTPAAAVATHSIEANPHKTAGLTRKPKERQREHYQMCTTIQAMLPVILAQHTQKIASVNSGFEDNTLRIIDISRGQYTRKPLKCVVDLCTCCAKTQKVLKFLLGFFSRSCLSGFQSVCPAARAKGFFWIFGEGPEICIQHVVWIWEFVWNFLKTLFLGRMIRVSLKGDRPSTSSPRKIDQ